MSQSPFDLIKSNDEAIWRNGLDILIKEHDKASFNGIVSMLSDISWHKREVAALALQNWQTPDLPSLLKDCLDPSQIDQFYWILKILGNLGTEECISLIKPVLSYKDSELRGYAVRALGLKCSLNNARALYPMLNDTNWAVRKLAFEHLLSFGEIILDDLRKIILASFNSSNHSVIALFIKIGKDGMIPELKTYYSKGSFSVRHAILSAIGELESNQAIDFLIDGLSDPSWALRLIASEQLSKLGPRAFDRLTASFGRTDSIVRHEIVKILVSLLSDKALPLINRLLSAPDQEHRMLAIENLARLKSDEATNTLISCLSDQDRIVSDYAADCLAQKSNLNLDLIIEKLNTEDENLRFQIIKIIGSIGGIALTPIIRILENGTKQERLFLLGVLQKIAPNEVLIALLINLLKDKYWPIRNAAANCLVRYETAGVRAVVIALNDQSEDVRFWASKVLSQIGPKAIKVLTDVLSDGTDPNLTPHIISALLSMSHPDAVPAVTKFLEDNDDYRIESVFASVPEINSKDVVSTILGLLTHPEERVAIWLSKLLTKVKSLNARRTVFLGLSHSNEKVRYYVSTVIASWENITENDIKIIGRQLFVEKTVRNLRAVVVILAKNPFESALQNLNKFLEKCDPPVMLDLMFEAAKQSHPECLKMLDNYINQHSEIITLEDVEQVGNILSYLYKDSPEGLIKGLSSASKAYRMCCIIALDSISDRKLAFSIMENLIPDEDPEIMERAVKTLSKFLFHDDFRLKGAVTEFMLELGTFIEKPLAECIDNFENEIDRKAIIDLIESVGGKVDPTLIRKKNHEKVILSDSHLDEVLERRKQAMEEIEKYDELIKVSHTMDLAIMFTDVKGFTAFSSKASLSEVMSMLKQHDEILQPVFKKYGGDALKKIGDAFLVVFENHSNALLAAIEIQKRLREFNQTVPEERKLAIRIAINSGSVIRTENDVMGDAVNLASRIEGIADAFEIVISEFTLARIDKSVFELEPHGTHQFKGIAKPVAAYKVKWQ